MAITIDCGIPTSEIIASEVAWLNSVNHAPMTIHLLEQAETRKRQFLQCLEQYELRWLFGTYTVHTKYARYLRDYFLRILDCYDDIIIQIKSQNADDLREYKEQDTDLQNTMFVRMSTEFDMEHFKQVTGYYIC